MFHAPARLFGFASLVALACSPVRSPLSTSECGKLTMPSGKPLGPRLIRIEGGEFEMGSTNGSGDETLVRRVTVATFYLDETEVTAGQYAECVQAGVCLAQTSVLQTRRFGYRGAAELLKIENESCNLSQPLRRDHPMNCVDWYQANRFCAWVNERLPTAAEWEYAARGPGGRKYPWGNAEPTPDRGNISGEEEGANLKARGAVGWTYQDGWHDGFLMTSPVTAFAASRTPDGVYGLGDNVAEWTASHPCASASDESCTNQSYEIRGSTWASYTIEPSWSRMRSLPMRRSGLFGFRCASDSAPPKSASH